jgi:hypothetical protein
LRDFCAALLSARKWMIQNESEMQLTWIEVAQDGVPPSFNQGVAGPSPTALTTLSPDPIAAAANLGRMTNWRKAQSGIEAHRASVERARLLPKPKKPWPRRKPTGRPVGRPRKVRPESE